MGEVISMQEYLERKTAPTADDLRKRIAAIAIEQVLLGSEKARLEAQLLQINRGE